MTESPFPFEAVDEAPAVSDESEKDGSRRTVVALGAVGALVVAAGAFFLLSGGDAEEEFTVTPAKRVASAAAPAVAEQAVTVPTAVDVKLGRNPFKPLYTEPEAPPAPVVPPAPVEPVAPVAPPTGQIIVVTAPAPAPTSQPTSEPAPAPSTVKLLGTAAAEDGSDRQGTFVLDGKEYVGGKGAIFGGKLLVVDFKQDADGDWYAVLQVGDGSPFDVHENQEVVVPS